MDSWEECDLYLTPDADEYRDMRHTRQVRALADILLLQVYFKDDAKRAEYKASIVELIEGAKFDMRRLKPKKKG